MRNFRELDIWKVSMGMSKVVFQLAKQFPNHEQYSLISQINRSTVSIPSNIAEGCSRSSNKEFIRFLEIAMGSSYELETQLLLSFELTYLSKVELENLLSKLSELLKKINAFIKSVKKF